MFGGYGISTGGLTIAILTDLGEGEKLWLKSDEATRCRCWAADSQMFTCTARGGPRSMNYFSSPEACSANARRSRSCSDTMGQPLRAVLSSVDLPAWLGPVTTTTGQLCSAWVSRVCEERARNRKFCLKRV